jgi:hypothetical protein
LWLWLCCFLQLCGLADVYDEKEVDDREGVPARHVFYQVSDTNYLARL